MKVNKKIVTITLCAAAAIALIGLGLTVGYLTDFETKENIVTIGDVDLEISEGSFEPSQTIPEGKKITKAPQIKNTGTKDEYVFFKVAVPKRSVTLLYESDVAGPSPHKEGEKVGEQSENEIYKMLASTPPDTSEVSVNNDYSNKFVFQYHNGVATSGSERKGWVLLSRPTSKIIDSKNYSIYVFGYNQKLIAGDNTATNTTVTLFDQVQLKSFIDEEISGNLRATEVDVTAYGIQADELDLDGLGDFLTEVQLKTIWDIIGRKDVTVSGAT